MAALALLGDTIAAAATRGRPVHHLGYSLQSTRLRQTAKERYENIWQKQRKTTSRGTLVTLFRMPHPLNET
jgi:hypothetical protein